MIVFPNAKLNLGLNVTSRREDGFHNIETVFFPIGLTDILECIEDKVNKTNFKNSGIKIDCLPQQNLVLKAYHLLKNNFDLPEVSIHLHKNIPFGAGLGGGSSNASFMLKLLNEKFELNQTDEQLEKYALALGSDCPFFIRNTPKLATGRGEIFSPVEINLNGYHLFLVNPGIHIATKAAYDGLTLAEPAKPVKDILQLPAQEWKDHLKNDFEKTVFELHPSIKSIKEAFYQYGAIYASMSGSGSSVFGIFEHNIPDDLRQRFKEDFSFSQIL
jgi:4-diphosphocytidyl-2-C-methyl-D-erythritol kinase